MRMVCFQGAHSVAFATFVLTGSEELSRIRLRDRL